MNEPKQSVDHATDHWLIIVRTCSGTDGGCPNMANSRRDVAQRQTTWTCQVFNFSKLKSRAPLFDCCSGGLGKKLAFVVKASFVMGVTCLACKVINCGEMLNLVGDSRHAGGGEGGGAVGKGATTLFFFSLAHKHRGISGTNKTARCVRHTMIRISLHVELSGAFYRGTERKKMNPAMQTTRCILRNTKEKDMTERRHENEIFDILFLTLLHLLGSSRDSCVLLMSSSRVPWQLKTFEAALARAWRKLIGLTTDATYGESRKAQVRQLALTRRLLKSHYQ